MGLHRRADGSLLLACPRRIIAYADGKRTLDVDLDPEGKTVGLMMQSALIGDTLLYADKIRGLSSYPVA